MSASHSRGTLERAVQTAKGTRRTRHIPPTGLYMQRKPRLIPSTSNQSLDLPKEPCISRYGTVVDPELARYLLVNETSTQRRLQTLLLRSPQAAPHCGFAKRVLPSARTSRNPKLAEDPPFHSGDFFMTGQRPQRSQRPPTAGVALYDCG